MELFLKHMKTRSIYFLFISWRLKVIFSMKYFLCKSRGIFFIHKFSYCWLSLALSLSLSIYPSISLSTFSTHPLSFYLIYLSIYLSIYLYISKNCTILFQALHCCTAIHIFIVLLKIYLLYCYTYIWCTDIHDCIVSLSAPSPGSSSILPYFCPVGSCPIRVKFVSNFMILIHYSAKTENILAVQG